jgi:glycosyltransferase involved in cell wall biosynthesis
MAYGLPLVTSRKGACAEVAEDAAMIVEEPSASLVKEALSSLLRDEQLLEDLSHRSRVRGDLFTWEKAADSTWMTIESCARSK